MEVKDTEMKTYILSHLNQAIEEGWIRPYFQPVVRTVSRKMCSVEALARWEDPEKELLPPNCFIPILEQNKEIHRLDCCIVRQICQLYRKNVLRHEEVVPCSFNLSRLDFELCDIFSYVEENVKEYEIPREMLHIEITESALSDNPEEIKKNIARFQNAGYQVWMDDFGDGYSSLNTLKDYKFDELKIDMVFLRNFNFRSRTIIRSVVDMAKEIHIQTLAEGVEDIAQFEVLEREGCQNIQGYLFSRPVAANAVAGLLRDGAGYQRQLRA